MGVHRAPTGLTEEGDGCSDHALLVAVAVEEADDVVAGLLQGTQSARVDDAFGASDGVQQALGVDDEFNGVEITDAAHGSSLPPLTRFAEPRPAGRLCRRPPQGTPRF